MGLDVVYCQGLEFTRSLSGDGLEEDLFNDEIAIYEPSDFQDHQEGLQVGVYTFQQRNHFRAGSYSIYNDWREALCKLVNNVPPDVVWAECASGGSASDKIPFAWLINFSDCEGVIGPVKSAILAEEFREWRSTLWAKMYLFKQPVDIWPYALHDFFGMYDDFFLAFEIAKTDGLVAFC